MFLDGVRVLDLTDERGLVAGRVMADLGADVVQVEPVDGSSARRRNPLPPGDKPHNSYVWQTYAANKRGIVADTDTRQGADLVRTLAGAADVLIESAAPGTLAASGLDFEDLHAVNPRLVYLSITPFGRTGPKAHLKAPDLVAWAAGGPLDEHRDGDRPPLRISLPQAYLHAALDGAAGALLALAARRRTGRGQLVDVAVQCSLTTATLGHALTYAVGDVPRDMTKGHVLEAPRIDQSGSGSNTDPTLKKWACRDGMIEFHIGIGPASGAFTNDFIAWLADEGAPVDDFARLDFRTVPAKIASGEFSDHHSARLRAVIKDFFATRTKAEVLEAAITRKLLCVPICDIGDIVASPQLAARAFFVTVGQGDDAVLLPGPFAHTSLAGAMSVQRRAPRLGEHQQEVLDEWLQPRRTVAPSAVSPQRGRTPLEGLKVVDFSWVVAGPLIGRALADFGATVVRVESAGRIETARFMQPFVNGELGPENSALYGTCNAGKLGLTLNLATEQGREIARKLADWADVVIESFSPGRMAKWGLDYETLSRHHPGLVMLSTSINGQHGPHAQLAGYGNVGAALSGFQFITGWPDRSPIGPFGPYTDYVGPRASLAALLAALDHRDRTGQGCYLDVAQVEAGIWLQAPEIADCAANGTVATRTGNADREFAPHGVFRCQPDPELGGDRHIAVVVTDETEWAALAETTGRPDLRDDQRLQSADGRLAHAVVIESAIAAWTADHDVVSAETILQQAAVPAHRSANSRDLAEDPQIVHRGHFVHVSHPVLGQTVVEGPRYLLSETPGTVRRAAPTFGQDNDYVLKELLGLGDEQVKSLRDGAVLQ